MKVLCVINTVPSFDKTEQRNERWLHESLVAIADELKARGHSVVVDHLGYARPDDHAPQSPSWGWEDWKQVDGVVSCHPINGISTGIKAWSLDNEDHNKKWTEWYS